MNARECYRELEERLQRGEPSVSATVVRTKGSTPREPGAKMLVTPEGSLGTVGGGCGEAEVLEVALDVLSTNAVGSRLVRVDLTEAITETADRICGGVMDVLVEVWRDEDAELRAGLHALAAPPAAGVVRLMPIAETTEWTGKVVRRPDEVPGSSALADACAAALRDRLPHLARTDDGEVFVEFVGGLQTVLICGAGHIAQPLSRLAKLLDYSVVVVDDRPEFASVERFTEADRVLADPFDRALGSLDIGPDTLAVLVTRGHRHDEFCLRLLLETNAGYVGMLGSKRRVRAVLDDLTSEGFTPSQLQRIWAPIGIDIGALTPAEIAVSIMAELVALRRGRSGGHMKLPPRAT